MSRRRNRVRILSSEEASIQSSLLGRRAIGGSESGLQASIARHKKKLTRERTQLRNETRYRSTQNAFSLSSIGRSRHKMEKSIPSANVSFAAVSCDPGGSGIC